MYRNPPNSAPLPPIGDRSYGIIVLRYHPSLPSSPDPSTSPPPTPQNTRLLLIHQRSLSRPPFWCFPKGHPESHDPSPLHTAIREIREETGLVITPQDVLHSTDNGRDVEGEEDELVLTEQYLNPIKQVGKEVRYWVAILSKGEGEKELRLQNKEVNDARWCDWDEAVELATFEETRGIVRRVREVMERGMGGGEGEGGCGCKI